MDMTRRVFLGNVCALLVTLARGKIDFVRPQKQRGTVGCGSLVFDGVGAHFDGAWAFPQGVTE